MKETEQVDNLYRIRHSLAHLLAKAVIDYYPQAKATIGPPVENGFYYDFDFGGEIPTESDLKKIEKKMRQLLPKWELFSKIELDANEAEKVFRDNEYKLELVRDIKDLGETITIYYSGPSNSVPTKEDLLDQNYSLDKSGFIDLCRGGHVENPTKDIDSAAFALDSIAGAYWRGDIHNKQLTRIYGLAFEAKDDLEKFITQREEAKKRDHRKLGKQIGLFTFSDLVGKGLPMFLPKGNILREEIANFVTEKKKALGYQFVHIPHIAKKELYERSGHMGKYDAMMPTMVDEEGDEYVMKAMNCPHHFELYNSQTHSYRDLPLRYAENTAVYRNEKSGELHGLTRVKALTQDDTHHFIRPDQIESEIVMVLGLMKEIYSVFGFDDYSVQISVRDPQQKENYFGDDVLWSKTEKTLIDSVKDWGAEYTVEEGEAAFYGPKIDFMVKDSLGRQWQLATVQLDFNQPERFDMTYTAQDGTQQRPAVLHVAILGSIERFLGILIEHYAGAFPLWLSPSQIQVLPVAATHEKAARELTQKLVKANIRAELIDSEASLGKRIREAKVNKIPYFVVIGDNEVNSGEYKLESPANPEISGSLDLVIEKLREMINNHQ